MEWNIIVLLIVQHGNENVNVVSCFCEVKEHIL